MNLKTYERSSYLKSELWRLFERYHLASHAHMMVRDALDLNPELKRYDLSWEVENEAAAKSSHAQDELREMLRSMLSETSLWMGRFLQMAWYHCGNQTVASGNC